MNKKVNIGVIGLGRLGSLYTNYCANRLPHANLVAVSDVREEVAKQVAEQYGAKRWYQNYKDLLADDEVEAIVIVTPTNLHKPVAIDAARAGKAIFCEKPLSLSIAECIEIKNVMEETRAFFQMGFMRRFDSAYIAAKQKIEEGVIGKRVQYKATSRDRVRPELDFLRPENSGGLFVDMGIHDFDIARFLMGEVKSVFTVAGVLAYPEMKEIGDVDNAIVTMYFEDGTLGAVDLSRNAIYGYDIQAEILGTEGTLQMGYTQETPIRVMKENNISHDTVPGFYERFEKAYVNQLADFVDNVRNNKNPSITVNDGIEALKIALAAAKSYHENRQVDLSEI
ncbi:MAG: inositol 2-dehydrogenase [Verrucomicrobia bacterium]|nr:inositol 2-dehydrogenase [Verrucomicrobiota bacterium]MDA1065289.1 inositol 2-dehydrogenase [Verrucomicrobiota bacterium]